MRPEAVITRTWCKPYATYLVLRPHYLCHPWHYQGVSFHVWESDHVTFHIR